MDPVQATVNQHYRKDFGKLVACLLSLSKDIDIAAAEDIAQETFSVAIIEWSKNGIPANPSGWLYTVCRNKALNQLKKSKANSISIDIASVSSDTPDESPIDDQQLKLLFTCAHPDLPPKTQVAITLKYVVNLKVEAIAKLLGLTIDGVDKILVRARQKIKLSNLLREPFDSTVMKSRLPIVHKVIYLIFNEGYKSSWGKEIIREELCEEALILNHSLLESNISNQATLALHALMLFNTARIKSRFAADGAIVELEKQDRSQWDKDLIALANDFLDQSRGDIVSTYHIEASIAYLHCKAPNFESTDWSLIVKLYQQLLRDNPNPFVEMNFAIALFYAGDRNRAFEILNRLHQHPFLSQSFLLNATLGKLNLIEGHHTTAGKFLLRAYELTAFEAEKNLIQRLIDSILTA